MARVLLTAVVLASASRLSYLYASYLAGAGGVGRHHVESAATLFVVLGVLLALLSKTRTRDQPHEPRSSAAANLSTLPIAFGFCAVALALYWPALLIGALSDDYVLLHRAAAWDLSPVTPTLFRPIPLAMWSAALSVGAGPAGLHALNVILHGLTAWLGARVIAIWIDSVEWSVAAGLLIVTAPIASEAVVWLSGVFDLSAAVLILASLLIANRYPDRQVPLGRRAALIAASLAAVLCKETAAVGPLIVAAFSRPLRRPALARDLALVIAVIGVFAGIRLFLSPEPSLVHVTKYAVQRALFAAFGGLAAPFHQDVVELFVWLPLGCVLTIVCLATWFFASPGPRRDASIASLGIVWIVISIVPAWPILVVGLDLQASRYLYVGEIGWALALVAAARSVAAIQSRVAIVPRVAIGLLIAASAVAAHVHLAHWQEAAQLRDAVLSAADGDPRMKACGEISIAGAPDSVRGAYVFRNGLAEALLPLELRLIDSPAAGCAFKWDGEARRLIPH